MYEQQIDVEREMQVIGGTNDYEKLKNKPSINGIEIDGDKTPEDYGILPYDDTKIREEIAQNTQKIETIDTEIEQLTDNMNEINGKVEKNITDISTLNSNLNEVSQKVEEHTTKISEIETKDQEQDESIEEHSTAIQNLNIDVENAEKEIIDLKTKKADKTEIPTKNSQLENDSNFITKMVEDLVNYYRKNETYTQEEINQMISTIPKFKIEVVDELPTQDISPTTIYLLKTGDESGNLYTEYIYVNNQWEKLGTQKIDLSNYATLDDLNEIENLLNQEIENIKATLEMKQNIMQYEEMPIASADNLGKIFQYTGETETYTQGRFYVCTTDGAEEPSYQWVEVPFAKEKPIKLFELIGSSGQTNIRVIDLDCGIYAVNKENLGFSYDTNSYLKILPSSNIFGNMFLIEIDPLDNTKKILSYISINNGSCLKQIYEYNESASSHLKSRRTTEGSYFGTNSFLTKNANERISGKYTFKSYLPEADTTLTPKTNTQFTPKKYVDDQDKILDAKIKEIEMVKFPNATIIGEPTIQQGQVSNFSLTDYLEFPFLVDFRNRPFEINFAFTTGQDIDTQQNILDSDFGMAFAIRNKHLVLALSFNGTSWATEQTGTLELQPQITYRIKITWNRILYKVQYSTDGGVTYIDDISFGQTQSPYPKQMYIGTGKLAQNFFKGIVNLNYADVKISDQLIWQGMDDVGLASRLATDLSNIDQAGIDYINGLIDAKVLNALEGEY